jgi:hypothetical protein
VLNLLNSVHNQIQGANELDKFCALLLVGLELGEQLLKALVELDQEFDQRLRMQIEKVVLSLGL